jgi:NAD(P)-dependent dehydrogenase (short-subunit alcohol dehydrogenase family)
MRRVDGVIHTIRAVAPGMQERGYGRIVNIASLRLEPSAERERSDGCAALGPPSTVKYRSAKTGARLIWPIRLATASI